MDDALFHEGLTSIGCKSGYVWAWLSNLGTVTNFTRYNENELPGHHQKSHLECKYLISASSSVK